MTILMCSLVLVGMALLGSAIIALVVRSLYGKNIAYPMLLFLSPALTILILDGYLLWRHGLSHWSLLLLTRSLGVVCLLAGFYWMGRSLMKKAQGIADRISASTRQLLNLSHHDAQTARLTAPQIPIDELAFQARILALTTAVEAVREGEAGAQLAVIAAVDKLSQLVHRQEQIDGNCRSLGPGFGAAQGLPSGEGAGLRSVPVTSWEVPVPSS